MKIRLDETENIPKSVSNLNHCKTKSKRNIVNSKQKKKILYFATNAWKEPFFIKNMSFQSSEGFIFFEVQDFV
jgi:hypothetical protein